MPLISWFTQPPGKNASFYQYDTGTRQFTRIRLELGRGTLAKDSTFISYTPKRAVGFSKTTLKGAGNQQGKKSPWSVNDKGELLYNGKALPGPPPKPGDNIYDTSNPDSFVHPGNPVTDKPIMVSDIKPEHLAMLANESFITGKVMTTLTPGSASGADLTLALKGQVCDVLGHWKVEDWSHITDDMILSKLISQAKVISDNAAGTSVTSLKDALTAAKAATAQISEQITEGFTPSPELQKAFQDLDSALATAQKASSAFDAGQALAGVTQAQQAVETALKNVDASTNKATADQLNSAKDALATAQQHATEWQATDADYKPLTGAENVDDYMKALSGSEEGV